MRNYIYILIALIYSCGGQGDGTEDQGHGTEVKNERILAFKTILDSADVRGSILIYDVQKKIYYSNDFAWSDKGELPASTFKIVNSIIALETGVVQDEHTMFKWDGEPRAIKNWEQDLTFRNAFHLSCVPCYQDVARQIGVDRMIENLRKLNYGYMIVDSTNIDLFWLEGPSKISPFQQIGFLYRFYNSQLDISERTQMIMKKMMIIEENDGYQISGKTGWSIRNDRNNGWFVGCLQKKEAIYYFATNIEPKANFNMDHFPAVRREVTIQALKELGVIAN